MKFPIVVKIRVLIVRLENQLMIFFFNIIALQFFLDPHTVGTYKLCKYNTNIYTSPVYYSSRRVLFLYNNLSTFSRARKSFVQLMLIKI